MGITISLAISIFLLGAAVGALLTRLQWFAFRQKASEEIIERLRSKPPIEHGITKFGRPNVATFITPLADDSHPVTAASSAAEHTHAHIGPSRALNRMLEQNEMEIAGILQEVQELWGAVGSFGNAPDRIRQYAYGDGTNNRRAPQTIYARRFNPKRALKPD
jgi:hypothetical protein